MRSMLIPIISKSNYVVINFKLILNLECHVDHRSKKKGRGDDAHRKTLFGIKNSKILQSYYVYDKK